MTDKQKLASSRNWMKARLIGWKQYDPKIFSIEEQIELNKVKDCINRILSNWNNGTKALGLTPSNTKKCCICWMKRKLPDGHMCRQCIKAGLQLSARLKV